MLRPLGTTVDCGVFVMLGGFAVAACSLTEEVRTRPGAPGEIGFLGNGGSDAGRASGGAGNEDGGDAHVDGASGTSGRGGRGGVAGRSSAGGSATDGGGSVDAGPDALRTCSVDITFACHDYCNALSLVPECRDKLRASAGLGPEVDAGIVDGGPPSVTAEEMVDKCKCDCELRNRTVSCRSDFDQFIMCGTAPLTLVCATDPLLAGEFPSIVGPCGALRAEFLNCLDTAPPLPDSGP